MFYNNMYETSSKLNEILILNRQLRNYLSMKGGSARQNLFNFKEKLNKHRYYIFYLFCLCVTTIIYLCILYIPTNKKFIGGQNSVSNDTANKMDDIYTSLVNYFNDLLDKLLDLLSKKYEETAEDLSEQIEDTVGPIVDEINNSIAIAKDVIFDILWSTPLPPFFPPFLPLIIILLLITYGCSNFILDRKLYLPCWGCQDGNIIFKCMPGTGKGSISCTIYTEFLNTIKTILKQFQSIGDFINIIKNAIKEAINAILYIVNHITGWITDAFSHSVGAIFDALKFLARMEVPDSWGFNLGEFLLCSDFSLKGNDCIYYKNGKLREEHGKGPLLEAFFKVIRVILEIPPSIPKFPFSGGSLENLKISEIKKPTIKEPKIKKHKINTETKSHSEKPVPIVNDKKDIIYENLLKVLIKIEINPIKWLAALFNLLIDAINLVIDGILIVLKEVMTLIFSIITECAKAITGAMGKIFNELLVPIDKVVAIAGKLPKLIYKTIKDIFDVGIFAIISHYFYSMLTDVFPFLKYIKSFIIIITLVVIIMSILIICPMIGAYYSFFKPYNYIKTTIDDIGQQIIHTFKNFDNIQETVINFIQSLEFSKEINEQLNNMKSSYKYVSGVVIIIIIIFIILNMFTNVNKYILTTIRNLIYNNYKGKFNELRKNLASYKLNKIINENNEMRGITKNYDTIMRIRKEELEKEKEKNNVNNNNISVLDRIDNITNLNFNQLKSFT